MKLRPSLLPAFGVFASAARYQNFAHAAEELHLTASAVSHHVRKLESALGVTLFQRHARGAVLTASGRALADAAATALTDLDAAAKELQASVRIAKQLRVTTLHSLTYCWLVPKLPKFTALHPHIRLNLDTSMSLTRFDDDGPDLGIRHGHGPWPGLTAHHLMDEHLFPVASSKLPGIENVTSAEHIPKLPLIGDLAHQGWTDWFRAAGVRGTRLKELHTFNDSTDALQAAAHGLGVALARTQIASPYLANGTLIQLPGPMLKARFSYYIVYPTDRRLTTEAAAFISWLREEARNEQSQDLKRHRKRDKRVK
jgi:LysR family transcriptional regulator, glycine cleavage system transcriptional activator